MFKKFLFICWIANIVAILYLIVPFFLLNYSEDIFAIFFRLPFMIIFYLLGLLSMVLWGYCLYNSNKFTNNSIHLVFLILLSSLYVPFFYLFFVKKKI